MKKGFCFVFLTLLINLLVGKANAQSLNIKCFFQGYYNSSSNSMAPVVDPINYPNLFDTVKVELVNSLNGAIVFSQNEVATINGDLNFNLPQTTIGQDVFIAIKHRNCVKTWSASSILIGLNNSYDFTNSVSSAFGSNMFTFPNGKTTIYSADLNNDGIIDLLDISILTFDINQFLNGYYLLTDLNGDLIVDLQDLLLLDNNLQNNIIEMKPIFSITFLEENITDQKNIIFKYTKDQIEVASKLDILSMKLFDVTGKLISQKSINSREFSVYKTQLQPAIYFFELELSDNTISSIKFIID
jgi:hypothetical protein